MTSNDIIMIMVWTLNISTQATVAVVLWNNRLQSQNLHNDKNKIQIVYKIIIVGP